MTTSNDQQPITSQIMQFLTGKEISGAVVAAAELRLADAIGDEPVPVEELATKVGADPDALFRLMRALTTLGLFRASGERSFAHTELSAGLRSDAPERLLDMILLEGAEWGWKLSSRLAEPVRTGKPLFPEIYGKDLFSYFMEDEPEAGQVFDRAMTAISESAVGPIVDALDVTGVRKVVDVGGGQGSVVRAILQRNPGLSGVVFDIEPALGDAHAELRDGELSSRTELIAGDCRESVPVTADLYLFRHVLHMWDDEGAARILRNVAASAAPGARVVAIEQLVTEGPDGQYVALLDLHMLAVGGGRARSELDFARLFEKAGLRLTRVTPTSAGDQLVEAEVVDGR
ncbi:methyltransferase [Sphaerisporangium sp. TRM90804]|uniref:methyltransferase n=1 Tax=Sphaerisporangium sp. TRM90804 TaxID=3031113 RepID=UPI002448D6B2|nr:methyltransferase [Sphaerisporangium sp. TRM90804]MDH2429201.1 methyltransferase [Sphaerisporangium sp. TRM90804]